MTERRRGGLGRGLGALIPTARTDDELVAGISRRDATADHALALVGGRGTLAAEAGAADGRDELPPGAVVYAADDADGSAPDAPASHDGGQTAIAAPVASGDGRGPAPDGDATGATEVESGGIELRRVELTDVGARYAELDPSTICPNPRQPRVVFDEDALAELVHSIREIGILQPVVVRELPGGEGARYELVMGERRWRAAREAGLATIPAIIRDTPDNALLRDALLENLHRAQLNPLEEAAAYDQLLQDFGCTQDQLAERIGRSRPQISNTLRLLKLPPSVQRRLAAGVLSAGHARALLGLAEAAAQERLAQRVVAEGLSVRSVEEIVAVGPADGLARTGASRVRRPVTAEQTDLEQRLSDRFDTRVRIERGRLKGKIVIEFASAADMARIVAVMEADAQAPADEREPRSA